MTDSSRPDIDGLLAALSAGPARPAPAPAPRGDEPEPDDSGDANDAKTDSDSSEDKPKGIKAKLAASLKKRKENWPKRWSFKWFVRWGFILAMLLLFNYACHPMNLFNGTAGQSDTHKSQTADGPQGRKGADIEVKGDKLSFNAGNGSVYLIVNGDKQVTGIEMDKGLSDYDTVYFGSGSVPADNNLSDPSVDADRCDQDSCTFEKSRDLCSGWMHVVANIDDGTGGLTNRNFTKTGKGGDFSTKCS